MSDAVGGVYRLRVFSRWEGDSPVRDLDVPAESWRDSLQLRIPGFDGTAVLDLSEAWSAFHSGGGQSFEGEATSRETITKFGEMRQRSEQHRVRIETVRAN